MLPGIEITLKKELDLFQLNDLYRLYQEQWWLKGLNHLDIKKYIANSNLNFVALASKNKRLIGFARVLTDFMEKALILDVLVSKNFRNKGLGKKMINCILSFPALVDVKSFELYCLKDLIPFYQKWGFKKTQESFLLYTRKNSMQEIYHLKLPGSRAE